MELVYELGCSHTRLVQRYNTRLVRGREGFSAYEARTEVQYEARKEECGGEAMWVECMGAQCVRRTGSVR